MDLHWLVITIPARDTHWLVITLLANERSLVEVILTQRVGKRSLVRRARKNPEKMIVARVSYGQKQNVSREVWAKGSISMKTPKHPRKSIFPLEKFLDIRDKVWSTLTS